MYKKEKAGMEVREFTEEIAQFIKEVLNEQLQLVVINTGKTAILDCLGLILAGCGKLQAG